MDWILVTLVTIIIILLGVLFWRIRPRHICPHCQAEKAQETGRDVAETRYVEEMSTFGGGDGGTHVKNVYEVRYRCQQCGHVWTEKEVD
jgi:rubredoxin